MKYKSEGKSVSDVIIDTFLRDVDEKGTMPWQRPYERYNAFNYFTKVPYRGINRLLLPFGEYITQNQIYQYNKDKGYIKVDSSGKITDISPEAYRFQKGIMWFPVVFFTVSAKEVSERLIKELFPKANYTKGDKDFLIGTYDGYRYVYRKGAFYRERNILKYYKVADRKHFRNSRGECLPSRIETGEVVIKTPRPMNVINNYINREGIHLVKEGYAGIPCYSPSTDTVYLNNYIASEDAWFSTAFHELGHSTGAENRLNREGVAGLKFSQAEDVNIKAKEECIAEICACLCCAETGVYDFKSSCTAEYDNNIAYVQAWKKRVRDWGNDFIFIVSQADKAFNYICCDPDDVIPDKGENDTL